MKLAFISPHFPPHKGGVSDFSKSIIQHFLEQGHEVLLITKAGPSLGHRSLEYLTLDKEWGGREYLEMRKKIMKFGAENVHIQWTPLSFGPKTYGFAPALLFFLFKLKTPKSLFVHESHYPVQLNLRGLLIGGTHFIQFLILNIFCQKLIFSHRGTYLFWSNILRFKRNDLSTIPVGSNIPCLIKKKERDIKRSDEKRRKKIVYFGGNHPTNLLGFVRKSLEFLIKKGEVNFELIVLGVNRENAKLFSSLKSIIPVSIMGHLDEESISKILLHSDLFLAPFLDGVSTRRGTIMAALEHECTIVSTRGHSTFDDIPWPNILYLSEAHSVEEYCNIVFKAFYCSDKNISKRGREYYMKYFDKKVIAESIIETLLDL